MLFMFQWICFWLISDSESVYGFGSGHVVIGDYTQLNTKDCGITRLSNAIADSSVCFEYHKNELSLLQQGRPTNHSDEAPWFAIVNHKGKGWCGGTLIANQWILTIGKCMTSDVESDYFVYIGTQQIGSAPGQIDSMKDRHFISQITKFNKNYDLVLGKLQSPVTWNPLGYPVRSICLPAPHTQPTQPELVFTIGRSATNVSVGSSFGKEAQIGYRKIITNTTGIPIETHNQFDKLNTSNMVFTVPEGKNSLYCKQDRGDPIWQYKNGRAVLIGVLINGYLADSEGNNPCNVLGSVETSWAGYMRIDSYIDWIKATTGLS